MNDTKETAVEAYTREHAHAIELLEHINTLLHDRPAPDDHAEQIHWGHVGDLGHVNELLTQVACFLMGVDESEL
jgi:hypothetical protein